MTTDATRLPDWLDFRARVSAKRVALVVGDRSWTFHELNDECSRLARRLATMGVRAGDTVASLMPNGATAAMLPHAVLRLGASLMPLNVRLRAAEIAPLLARTAPRVVVFDSTTAELVGVHATQPRATNGPVLSGVVPATFVASVQAGTVHATPEALATIIERDVTLRFAHPVTDVLAVIHTSGTTGQARGAMLTVGNFWWSAVGSALNLGVHDNDRWLAVLPLFHIGGLSILIRSAIYGTMAEVMPRFDGSAVNKAIDEGATIVSLVAVMLQRLLDERGERPFPSSLRCLLIGGGPVPGSLLERCARMGAPVVQTYGLTETCSQVATLAPEEALLHLGSAGRALYPNEIRIARAPGSGGGSGEIQVRGPVVMAGYQGDAESTARAMSDGWLRTGDIGRIDADGFLYVLDRRDDLIVSGGENVYPAEVEAALLAHPWVEEAGVIGAPDVTWGHRVVAVVRLRPEFATRAADITGALRAHCRERLAAYKAPAEVRVVSEPLPRTESGKLRRSALRG